MAGLQISNSKLKLASRLISIFIVLPFLLLFFQNCSPSSIQNIMVGNLSSHKDSGGNGEPYDGKPNYARLVPGMLCSNNTAAVGSLDIHGSTATLVSNENSCQNISTEVSTSQLEFSSFSKKYIGYQDGVYTYTTDRNENISKGIFTEAWCRALKKDSTDSAYEFAIEWQEQGQTAKLSVMTELTPDSAPALTHRTLDADRVSYSFLNSDLNIYFKQKVAGGNKVVGTFYGDIDGLKDQKINVECLMGGQFDSVAPQFDFSGSSNRTLAVGDQLKDFVPIVNKKSVEFSIDSILPAGLTFNKISGEISGVATATLPRQKFMISALFPFGKISRPVSIGVGLSQIVDQNISNRTSPPCAEAKQNCDLHGAIARANQISPVPLLIQIKASTIDLDGSPLLLTGDVSLFGSGTNGTTINAKSLSNHFTVSANGYLALNRLTMTNGKNDVGGSISMTDGRLLIQNSNFTNNSCDNHKYSSLGTGGAIDARHSVVEIFDSTFTNNIAPWNGSLLGGGAAYIKNGIATTIKNSVFTKNTGQQGGALYFDGDESNPFQIINSKFDSNTAIFGGAIYDMGANLSVIDSQFVNNSAIFDAGAIDFMLVDKAWIQNSVFDGNTGAGVGSSTIFWEAFMGIYHDRASLLYLFESKFINSKSTFPGVAVLLNYSGKIILRGTTFSNNSNLKNCQTMFNTAVAETLSLGNNFSSDGSCPK